MAQLSMKDAREFMNALNSFCYSGCKWTLYICQRKLVPDDKLHRGKCVGAQSRRHCTGYTGTSGI